MLFTAKARYIRYSPYKLRPIADVVRGKNAVAALAWLSTVSLKKVRPLTKVLASAIANAKQLGNVSPNELYVTKIQIDQGPMYRYFKPGAKGMANVYRSRSCHMTVELTPIE